MAMTPFIVLSLLFLLGALACLPIQASASFRWHDTYDIRWKIAWAWGVLGLYSDSGKKVELMVLGRRTGLHIGPLRKRDEAPEAPKPQRSKRRLGRLGLRQFLNERDTWFDILKRLVQALHWRGHIEGTVGLGDPADTAMLATVMRAVPEMAGPHLEIELAPDYLEATLAVSAMTRIHVVPAEFLRVFLTQLLRAPVRSLLWSAWRK